MLFCLAAAAIGAIAIQPAFSDEQADAVASHLPRRSALPPLSTVALDSVPKTDGLRKWEEKVRNWEVHPVTDPGIGNGRESLRLRVVDYVGAIDPLPFASSAAVVLADVTAASGHLADHRTAVYTTYTVKVIKAFNAPSAHAIQAGTSLTVCQMGGSLQFPSGHITHYIISGTGFMALHDRYLLFLDAIDQQTQTYHLAIAYFVNDGKVYPVNTGAPVDALAGVPLETIVSGH